MRPPLPDSIAEGIPAEGSHVDTVSEIVSEYLDTMLCSTLTEDPQESPAIKVTANKAATNRNTKSKEKSPLRREPQLEIIAEKSAASDQVTLATNHPEVSSRSKDSVVPVKIAPPVESIQSAQPQPKIKEKRPAQPWDLMELEWLLVAAGRLNLALPLIGLDSVQAFDKKVTPFSSGLDWLPGLARVKNSNIRLVDIASFLMGTPSELSNAQNIIILNNGNWGLLVDSIVTTMRIPVDQIQQTSGSVRFRWRHGILIDPVYTMVDPLGLGEVLEHSLTKSN